MVTADSPAESTLLRRVVEAIDLLAAGRPDSFMRLLEEDVVLRERLAGRTRVRLRGRDRVAALVRTKCVAGSGVVLETVVCGDRARVHFAEPWWRPSIGRFATRFLASAGCTASMDVRCSGAGISELSCWLGPLPGDPEYVEPSVFR